MTANGPTQARWRIAPHPARCRCSQAHLNYHRGNPAQADAWCWRICQHSTRPDSAWQGRGV